MKTNQPALLKMVTAAKKASFETAQLGTEVKNKILAAVACELRARSAWILAQNAKDIKAVKASGLSPAMIDRLTLNSSRIEAMARGVEAVANLPDPIGHLISSWKRPNGLKISKVSVPLGVILIIYESRPNVTVDCAALCFKSGNAVILRGGREAFYSNQALVSVFEKILGKFNFSKACVSFVRTTDRKAVDALLKMEEQINLVIPRGGQTLIRKVVRASRIPVVKHYQGICHIFVDQAADLKKAEEIVINAKLQRPGVCNAMETLLVHEKIAADFLPKVGERLKSGACELRTDKLARKYLPWGKPAKPDDFGREFLDKILAVKVVPDMNAAIQHIQTYGSGHTDAILSEDRQAQEQFKQRVDSASVMVNASTRFSDGFEFGFGAEIGISTDKIHARGPMGLEGLTSYKYVVEGNGQIRS
ncbi:MAG: glutamate-5-semialdehyde dehydrogenase [Candidatus Omnitrophica bacterium]|nr:glutamate-5-semialdehyde dehydrogenase [Candidatus Omnitrophota bacterium]